MARVAEQPALVVARMTFVGGLGGRDIYIHAGEVWTADDAAVRRWPDAFRPLVIRGSGAKVEAATSAPGEKRGE